MVHNNTLTQQHHVTDLQDTKPDINDPALQSITSSMNGLFLNNQEIQALFKENIPINPAQTVTINLRKNPKIKFDESIFIHQKAQLTAAEPLQNHYNTPIWNKEKLELNNIEHPSRKSKKIIL